MLPSIYKANASYEENCTFICRSKCIVYYFLESASKNYNTWVVTSVTEIKTILQFFNIKILFPITLII